MNALDFSGKAVLVVGGSSGIGNGVAHGFRQHGAAVHVWGTRPTAADYDGEAGSDLDGLAYAQVDVGDRGQIDAADGPDALDVLVLCQGIVGRDEFQRPDWDRVMAVNLDSQMACALRFRDALVARGGTIIMISSSSAYRATRTNPAYTASKTATVGLVKALGQAWAPEGVRVVGIAPGLVATRMSQKTMENPARLADVLGRIPLGRAGSPADIAGAALFLASPLAAYVVGQTLVVDGGLTL